MSSLLSRILRKLLFFSYNEYDLVDNISEKATTQEYQENNCIFIQIMFHVAVLNVVKIEDLMDTS